MYLTELENNGTKHWREFKDSREIFLFHTKTWKQMHSIFPMCAREDIWEIKKVKIEDVFACAF